ncbi:MAG: ABC transporter ATP-binding protein/permease [Oscillospiraceae bacterium]|nr:ABC transporter ATP-binding protein/permease [Oscillospiraceae bacterium]
MKDTSLTKMMMGFAFGIKRFFLFSIVASSAAALLGFLTPIIVGFTVDSVIGGESTVLPFPVMQLYELFAQQNNLSRNLLICAILAAGSAIIAGVFNYLSRTNMAKGAEHFTKRLRDELFSHTQNLPFEWHTKNLTGDIIQRCTSDVDTVRRFVFQQFIEVLRTAILIIIAYVIMFSINVTLALVVLIFIPITLTYSLHFYKRIGHKFLACDEAEGSLMVRVQENLTGVRVVRAFGRERYETERFDEKNIDYTNKWVSLGYTFGIYWGIGDIASATQLLVVIVFGSYLAATGSITFGDLLVFISYTLTLMWPVRALGRLLTEMSKTGVSLKRIKEIFDAPAESNEPNALRPPMDCDIEFRNVSFTYDENPVLKNVSFTIKHGSTFAILGATGSGKSTATYLLNRLYELPEDSGSITIGGVDIKDIDRTYLRQNVGLVLQEPFLFSRSIFENIDIASRRRDLNTVRDKAQIAAIDDNIMSFAKGYETLVGERGVTLSGGQKQRVAIARTLMMNAPIMIFDDSMSALDMETDAKIRDSLRKGTAGATVILISHRISTLMTADTIMVLEDGQIAEIGSHMELVKQNGIYRRIYDLQSGYVVE